MKTYIHVNQHIIKSNKVNKTKEPPLTAKTYKNNLKANNVIIKDKEGNIVARVVYQPDKPLQCGAVCWVETEMDVTIG